MLYITSGVCSGEPDKVFTSLWNPPPLGAAGEKPVALDAGEHVGHDFFTLAKAYYGGHENDIKKSWFKKTFQVRSRSRVRVRACTASMRGKWLMRTKGRCMAALFKLPLVVAAQLLLPVPCTDVLVCRRR